MNIGLRDSVKIIIMPNPTCNICDICNDEYGFRSCFTRNCGDYKIATRCPRTCQRCRPDCVDILSKEQCDRFKDYRDCERNGFVQAFCAATCKTCKQTCNDVLNPHTCQRYKNEGRCQNNDYVRNFCFKTCDLCGDVDCKDLDTNCDINFCFNEHHQKRCRKTCKLCDCKDLIPNCFSTPEKCACEKFREKCQLTCKTCECRDKSPEYCRGSQISCTRPDTHEKCAKTCHSCGIA
nr:uncharacterized protein LOC121132196 [Lepeophtheirus salmonis]